MADPKITANLLSHTTDPDVAVLLFEQTINNAAPAEDGDVLITACAALDDEFCASMLSVVAERAAGSAAARLLVSLPSICAMKDAGADLIASELVVKLIERADPLNPDDVMHTVSFFRPQLASNGLLDRTFVALLGQAANQSSVWVRRVEPCVPGLQPATCHDLAASVQLPVHHQSDHRIAISWLTAYDWRMLSNHPDQADSFFDGFEFPLPVVWPALGGHQSQFDNLAAYVTRRLERNLRETIQWRQFLTMADSWDGPLAALFDAVTMTNPSPVSH